MRDIKCVCFNKIPFYTVRGFDNYIYLQSPPPSPPLLLDVVTGDPCKAAILLLLVYCLPLTPLCLGFLFCPGFVIF